MKKMEEERSKVFGDFLKKRRAEFRLTLREFCLKAEIDPGNYSKIERGILPPPQDSEKLEKWARILKLEKESSPWKEFFDLASVSRGEIPPDVLEDKELAEALPLIFRTMRGDKISDEQFEKLKEIVKEAFIGR